MLLTTSLQQSERWTVVIILFIQQKTEACSIKTVHLCCSALLVLIQVVHGCGLDLCRVDDDVGFTGQVICKTDIHLLKTHFSFYFSAHTEKKRSNQTDWSRQSRPWWCLSLIYNWIMDVYSGWTSETMMSSRGRYWWESTVPQSVKN